jgi:hypothetical protein
MYFGGQCMELMGTPFVHHFERCPILAAAMGREVNDLPVHGEKIDKVIFRSVSRMAFGKSRRFVRIPSSSASRGSRARPGPGIGSRARSPVHGFGREVTCNEWHRWPQRVGEATLRDITDINPWSPKVSVCLIPMSRHSSAQLRRLKSVRYGHRGRKFSKEKAARRRLLNSNLMTVDQAASGSPN